MIANFTRRAGIDSMRPRTQVVLLDFDGTLAATHLAVIECARRTSAQLGHGLIAEQELRETIAKGLPLHGMSAPVKVFGCRPMTVVRHTPGAGVRKPPREETAVGGRVGGSGAMEI